MGVKLPLQADANDTDILEATQRVTKDGSFKIVLADDHVIQSGPIAELNTSVLVQWCDNVRAAIAVRNDMKEEKRLREAREGSVQTANAVAELAQGVPSQDLAADSPEAFIVNGYEAANVRLERAKEEHEAARQAFNKWSILYTALRQATDAEEADLG